MATDITQEKQQVHELIEKLAPGQIIAVRGLLEAMIVVDDEPVMDEDRRRIEDGRAWLAERGGKGIPMEQVLAEFGFKAEDFLSSRK
jgi:hypothetical protein